MLVSATPNGATQKSHRLDICLKWNHKSEKTHTHTLSLTDIPLKSDGNGRRNTFRRRRRETCAMHVQREAVAAQTSAIVVVECDRCHRQTNKSYSILSPSLTGKKTNEHWTAIRRHVVCVMKENENIISSTTLNDDDLAFYAMNAFDFNTVTVTWVCVWARMQCISCESSWRRTKWRKNGRRMNHVWIRIDTQTLFLLLIGNMRPPKTSNGCCVCHSVRWTWAWASVSPFLVNNNVCSVAFVQPGDDE